MESDNEAQCILQGFVTPKEVKIMKRQSNSTMCFQHSEISLASNTQAFKKQNKTLRWHYPFHPKCSHHCLIFHDNYACTCRSSQFTKAASQANDVSDHFFFTLKGKHLAKSSDEISVSRILHF